MTGVVVACEGPTEGVFVQSVLVPVLAERAIYLEPRLIATSPGAKGGSLKRDRVLRALRNMLRQRSDTYVTTMFDLYGLPSDFPGLDAGRGIGDPLGRAAAIEAQFAAEVARSSECPPNRFLAHLQPCEFEGLLFSDPRRFVEVEPGWQTYLLDLDRARQSAPTPEHINEGQRTHPSARLEELLAQPPYQKKQHGPMVAQRIGLARMREECLHFGAWLDRIEALPPLRAED